MPKKPTAPKRRRPVTSRCTYFDSLPAALKVLSHVHEVHARFTVSLFEGQCIQNADGSIDETPDIYVVSGDVDRRAMRQAFEILKARTEKPVLELQRLYDLETPPE